MTSHNSRGDLMAFVLGAQEDLEEFEAPKAILTLLTVLGHHLDGLSPQHPDLKPILDSLHRECFEMASRLTGCREPVRVQERTASLLRKPKSRLENRISHSHLESYAACSALIHAAVAAIYHREPESEALQTLCQKVLLPVGGWAANQSVD